MANISQQNRLRARFDVRGRRTIYLEHLGGPPTGVGLLTGIIL
jgi:hypothetical protein